VRHWWQRARGCSLTAAALTKHTPKPLAAHRALAHVREWSASAAHSPEEQQGNSASGSGLSPAGCPNLATPKIRKSVLVAEPRTPTQIVQHVHHDGMHSSAEHARCDTLAAAHAAINASKHKAIGLCGSEPGPNITGASQTCYTRHLPGALAPFWAVAGVNDAALHRCAPHSAARCPRQLDAATQHRGIYGMTLVWLAGHAKACRSTGRTDMVTGLRLT
jgi:hypothetical protein